MSKPFSDTTTQRGLVQFYEREIGVDYGVISGNPTKLKSFTADANSALDRFMSLAIPASGKWQLDDSNYDNTNGGYPIIYTNLVAGQRDYTFTTDESGNLILDIYKVAVLPSATDTLYQPIYPLDAQSDTEAYDLVANNTTTGTPVRYDKTANGLFLDPIPSYNAERGLKMYINREASYFTYTDTTKKPGVPGLFHSYFYLIPALDHARRKSLTSHDRILQEVLRLEQDIVAYFGKRDRDDRDVLTPEPICFK